MSRAAGRISGWIAAAYLACLVSIIVMADMGNRLLPNWRDIPFVDKVCHFLLIGSAALVLNLALGCRRLGTRFLNCYLGSLIVVILATLEELSQHFLNTRSCSIGDLGADYLGILFFGVILSRIRR